MFSLDFTHDPSARSWVEGADDHKDFPIQNLALGHFSPPSKQSPRIGVAIGDRILDLKGAAKHLELHQDIHYALKHPFLNLLLALPTKRRVSLRHSLFRALSDKKMADILKKHLYKSDDCLMHLPFVTKDYTDFYTGIHHATKVGSLFRPDNPLLPNYKHVPIAYHGRASTLFTPDVPVIRPKGQIKAADRDEPYFGPSQRLDYEMELGVYFGQYAPGGITIANAYEHIAGYCLLNDWSARDIQAWEYQPLGPFLAKNFHTTLSAWVITPEALAPFRGPCLKRSKDDPRPLPYLLNEDDQQRGALNITVEVAIETEQMREKGLGFHTLSRAMVNEAMYWSPAQMLAHHASNGCLMQPGDVLGTGTLSGPRPEQGGSLLELSDGGKTPISLPSGEPRRFLEDLDCVRLSARCEAPDFVSIGFGDCTTLVHPAL
jgi:fumarylacetoacetase